MAKIAKPSPDMLERAAHIIRAGGLVAFPTETVYGLGADAGSGEAVARIFEAKGRPRFNPLIVHVGDVAQAETYAEFGQNAHRMAEVFWPGPLTLVLPRRPDAPPLADLVSAGLPTVALRVPSHPVARALIAAAAVPIAAPSANVSCRVSATTAQHVAADFGDSIDLILDGGPSMEGLESTIVSFCASGPVLLRSGAVPRKNIEAVLETTLGLLPSKFGPRAPGMLASHYAPRARLRLDAAVPWRGEAFLAFGPHESCDADCLNLSEAGNLREAAANLFAHLRRLDAAGPEMIAVSPIPEQGLGEAINDRLRRAAAPRPA